MESRTFSFDLKCRRGICSRRGMGNYPSHMLCSWPWRTKPTWIPKAASSSLGLTISFTSRKAINMTSFLSRLSVLDTDDHSLFFPPPLMYLYKIPKLPLLLFRIEYFYQGCSFCHISIVVAFSWYKQCHPFLEFHMFQLFLTYYWCSCREKERESKVSAVCYSEYNAVCYGRLSFRI